MTKYHKAVRPNGTSFADPEFRWGMEPGDVTVHPSVDRGRTASSYMEEKRNAVYYLSVSTVPTDCVGMDWPARHLIVEPVAGYEVWTPNPDRLPNKRASLAWRTVEERPAHELLGPQGVQLAAFIERIHSVTEEDLDGIDELADERWMALMALRRVDLNVSESSRAAAMECVRVEAEELADYPRGVHARAWEAIYLAAEALLARDLIHASAYDTAVIPVESVLGPLHTGD